MTAAVSIGLGIAACSDINISDITKLPEDSEESGSSGQPEEPEDQPGEEPEKKAFYIEVAENHSDWSGEYLITWKSDVVYAIGGWDPYGQPASADGNDIDFMKYLTPEGIPAEKADNYSISFMNLSVCALICSLESLRFFRPNSTFLRTVMCGKMA